MQDQLDNPMTTSARYGSLDDSTCPACGDNPCECDGQLPEGWKRDDDIRHALWTANAEGFELVVVWLDGKWGWSRHGATYEEGEARTIEDAARAAVHSAREEIAAQLAALSSLDVPRRRAVDLVTSEQLGMLIHLRNTKGSDIDGNAATLFDAPISRLSREQADVLIRMSREEAKHAA